MATITMKEVIKSNRLKANALEAIKSDMKGILTKSQLDKLEQVFMTLTEGCMFTKEEVQNHGNTELFRIE